MTTQSASEASRRYDLDWIRVGAFALLILYHVGMFYGPWDWHVKSPRIVELVAPLARMSSPWRLTLLFFVSGAATRFMADKMSVAQLMRQRLARLLPPLAFAILVVVPPQSYLQIVEKLGYAGGWASFYGHYLTASGHWRPGGESLVTPTYNHMWFVAYLIAYTLVLTAGLAVARPLVAKWVDGAERALSGPGLLIWPALAFGVLRATLGQWFPETHALIGDWYEHAQSLPVFLLGFLLAKSAVFRSATVRARWPGLAMAITGYAVWAGGSGMADHGVHFGWAAAAAIRSAYGLEQWGAIVAVLGFVAQAQPQGGPVLRYLTLAVFPFYIVHQTLIVVAGHYLAKVGLPLPLEASLILTITVGGCFLANEVGRRSRWLAPLLGLNPPQRIQRFNRTAPRPVWADTQ